MQYTWYNITVTHYLLGWYFSVICRDTGVTGSRSPGAGPAGEPQAAGPEAGEGGPIDNILQGGPESEATSLLSTFQVSSRCI